MKSIFRKSISLILTAVMVLTVMTVGFVTPAFADGEAYLLSLPEAGSLLEDGKVYAVLADQTITGAANQNALGVTAGATAVIYIASGVTLTVTGGNGTAANGRTGATGGKAAIFVPSDATLILTGDGTLNATGGNGGNAANGQNGGNPYLQLNSPWHYKGGAKGSTGGNGTYETGLAKTDATVAAALTKTYTFDKSLGEGGDDSVTVTIGETVSKVVPPPTWSGHVFNGYFNAAEGAGIQAVNADGSSARIADLNPARAVFLLDAGNAPDPRGSHRRTGYLYRLRG